jgi:hypothetical protein
VRASQSRNRLHASVDLARNANLCPRLGSPRRRPPRPPRPRIQLSFLQSQSLLRKPGSRPPRQFLSVLPVRGRSSATTRRLKAAPGRPRSSSSARRAYPRVPFGGGQRWSRCRLGAGIGSRPSTSPPRPGPSVQHPKEQRLGWNDLTRPSYGCRRQRPRSRQRPRRSLLITPRRHQRPLRRSLSRRLLFHPSHKGLGAHLQPSHGRTPAATAMCRSRLVSHSRLGSGGPSRLETANPFLRGDARRFLPPAYTLGLLTLPTLPASPSRLTHLTPLTITSLPPSIITAMTITIATITTTTTTNDLSHLNHPRRHPPGRNSRSRSTPSPPRSYAGDGPPSRRGRKTVACALMPMVMSQWQLPGRYCSTPLPSKLVGIDGPRNRRRLVLMTSTLVPFSCWSPAIYACYISVRNWFQKIRIAWRSGVASETAVPFFFFLFWCFDSALGGTVGSEWAMISIRPLGGNSVY